MREYRQSGSGSSQKTVLATTTLDREILYAQSYRRKLHSRLNERVNPYVEFQPRSRLLMQECYCSDGSFYISCKLEKSSCSYLLQLHCDHLIQAEVWGSDWFGQGKWSEKEVFWLPFLGKSNKYGIGYLEAWAGIISHQRSFEKLCLPGGMMNWLQILNTPNAGGLGMVGNWCWCAHISSTVNGRVFLGNLRIPQL